MKYLPTAIALAVSLGAASAAQADTWHQTNTEAGYEIHIENNAGKSAETVRQELLAAKADKQAWYYSYRAQPKPFWLTESEKTREQVRAERDAVTPQQRARLAEIYGAGA
ncbi:Uncharacterised protein [Bordetella ansorpii]|uniref:Lipoprotein n=1 Tax=Bordetella ansorpii TaxID=288768 RepID=A0A157RQ60_9BORD|nr:hypothetical protein [Bordetella ansorpii]SAI60055.1 Uncharacterised protein [Bordetella ansorpii]SAI65464.1 Uncharacterised protein [Bordetella ansorpii]